MAEFKDQVCYVEQVDGTASDVQDGLDKVYTMGTVQLTAGKMVYIPTPTADTQDPLTMSLWRKFTITMLVSVFSTLGLALVPGFGGLLGFYISKYAATGHGSYADITHLMTYPSLFMGIGNLIGMPIAIAVGRRIVLLGSTLILVISAILCANAKTYEWHLGARMLMGIAAGEPTALYWHTL